MQFRQIELVVEWSTRLPSIPTIQARVLLIRAEKFHPSTKIKVKEAFGMAKLVILLGKVLDTPQSETTVYSDRPSIHYPPISEAIVNKEHLFLHFLYKRLNFDISCVEITCSISKTKIFFHCYKNT